METKFTQKLNHTVKTAAASVLVFMCALIIIWIFIPAWKEWSSYMMKFNSCLGFASASLSLFFSNEPSRRKLSVVLAFVPLFIGGFTLIEFWFKIPPGLDDFLMRDFLSSESIAYPGRISPITACCFVFLASSLLSLHIKHLSRIPHATVLFLAPVLVMALFAMIGYVYNIKSFYQFGPYLRIAWPSAICFLLLGIGILFCRPQGVDMTILTKSGLGGATARRLLPFAIVLPIALGGIRLYIQSSGWFDLEMATAVRTILSVALFVVIIWINARIIEKVDAEKTLEHQRFIAVQRDTLKALRAAVKSRDDFLSIASHELKTPLTALKLQTQLVKRRLDKHAETFDLNKAVEKINEDLQQIERLNRLVDDMLDISRLNSGYLTIQKEKTELSELVRNVYERHRSQFDELGYQVSLKANEKIFGNWDRFRIEQVVSNLLTNAMKYGQKKPVEISVEKNGKVARLTVKDRGMGIAEQNFDKIFDRFERVSPNEAGGLGLGLYIVRQLVEMHGGAIRVHSELGSGSTFTVELPLNFT